MPETWIQRAFRRSDERNEIARLEYAIEDIRKAFAEEIRVAKSSHDLDTLQNAEYQEMLPYYDQISIIRSKQVFETALRLGVPIPRQTDDSPHWEYSAVLGQHHLSDEGLHFLRREIAHERELRHKPVLSWGALAISFVGLALSIVALVQSSAGS